MGLRTAVLTVLSLLLWICTAAAAPRNFCLGCHPPHYQEQGSCSHCHRGNQQTNRTDLAHSGLIAGQYAGFTNQHSPVVQAGKKLAEQTACRRCHTLQKSGNRLASNLDSLLWTAQTGAIRKALIEPALFMPNFHFSAADLDRLITVILAGGAQTGRADKEPPQIVFFSNTDTQKQHVFVKQCGGCHKLLSKRDGGLGSGTAGPNLSGLLTRFYPPTFEGNREWTEDRLKRWLKNPRESRPQTLMRPMVLTPTEWQLLLKSFAAE